MPRNYAAEYAARTTRAQERGFTGYGQQRRASESLRAEISKGIERGTWPGPMPGPASKVMDLMLRAKAKIMGYSPSTMARAASKRESLLGRSKEGRALRDQLRQAFGWKSGAGWAASYFPMMRALYGKAR